MTDLGDIDINKKPSDLYEAGLIIGTLKSQLAEEKKYRLILGVRSRIERLEAIFRAKELLGGIKCNRVETWLTIFELSKDRMVNDLKAKIIESGLTIEEFCNSVGIIYGDFSDRAAHGIPLPKEIKDKDITEVVELLEVDDDEPIERTLNILVKKLKLVDKAISQKSTSSDSLISLYHPILNIDKVKDWRFQTSSYKR